AHSPLPALSLVLVREVTPPLYPEANVARKAAGEHPDATSLLPHPAGAARVRDQRECTPPALNNGVTRRYSTDCQSSLCRESCEMSAGPIILDYELTKEQLLAEWRKDVAQSRPTWRSRLVSGAVF